MKRFARIADGVVAEIITVPDGFKIEDMFPADQVATMVPAGKKVDQRWTWDGETFAEPVEDQSPAEGTRRFSFLEFMDLFPEAEQLTLVEAAMTVPSVKLWYDKALGAQFIDLDDPRTEIGLQAMVDAGKVTAERMAMIMAAKE